MTRQWHAQEVEKHFRSKWDGEVQTFRPGDDDGKQGPILNRLLTWRTHRIKFEAHAAALVNNNLRTEDRPVSTPGEDMNDNEIESEFRAPEEVMSFRADAARGHYLGPWTGKSAIQRQGKIASHVKTNKEGPAQTRANGEVFEGLGEPKHQVQGVGHQLANVHTIRFGWLLIRQEEHVRWSCVDEHRGCHTLELNAEVSVVVMRGRAVRREEGRGRGHGIQEFCPGGGITFDFLFGTDVCAALGWESSTGVVSERRATKTRKDSGCRTRYEIENWWCRKSQAGRTGVHQSNTTRNG